MYEGVPILLVRRGQKIFAIAETCSHFSGPLSEGKLSATALFVHITPLDLRLAMAVCLMGQPCIHSRAWRSGCETVRSKCANYRRKPKIYARRRVTRRDAVSSPVSSPNLDPSLHVESAPISPIADNILDPTKLGEPLEDSVVLQDCGPVHSREFAPVLPSR